MLYGLLSMMIVNVLLTWTIFCLVIVYNRKEHK